MLKKITSVSNAGVYRDFQWDRHVLTPTGQRDRFMAVNILYGRNYSGKTTLSRIIRSLQTGQLPAKLTHAAFSLDFENSGTVSDTNLTTHTETVRVFNDDFVRENLSLFYRDDGAITPFAVLGSENNAIKNEIAEIEDKLGSEDGASGLLRDLRAKEQEVTRTQQELDQADRELRAKLDAKANKPPNGIKHNKLWGDPNYKVPKLEQDIDVVQEETYQHLSDDEIDSLNKVLKEEASSDLKPALAPTLGLHSIIEEANILLTKTVAISEPMQHLLNEALLQNWAREGRKLHEGTRTTCGFCGNPIPADLWAKMDTHFNKESEALREGIEGTIERLLRELPMLNLLMNEPINAFYAEFHARHSLLSNKKRRALEEYDSAISVIEQRLKERSLDIFTPMQSVDPKNPSDEILQIWHEFEALKNDTNAYTLSLNNKRAAAAEALRLHDVKTFADTINYSTEKTKLTDLKTTAEARKHEFRSLTESILSIQTRIAALRASMKDETRGAQRVNELLANFFGHQALTLRSIETDRGYIFQVWRGHEQAFNLSQGEYSLIAFCYFVAKLDDTDTINTQPIVWIDDPVSSLDTNHVFFLFGLIRHEILRAGRCSQLFISTHHLDFLKFVMEIVPHGTKVERRYFIIERTGDTSAIKRMPKYFKERVSEFVYLFDHIFKCAQAPEGAESEALLANYGNNARKFLEIYLSYKYPGPTSIGERISKFFGDNGVGAALVERIHNEYSHLDGQFERALVPLDVAEMRQCAQFIVATIEKKDPEQFNSFKDAIGAP